MLDWLFGSRKKLRNKDVTAIELRLLDQSLWQSQLFSIKEREQLVRWCRVFIAEKTWEGCSGLTISEQMQWSVASMAGMMVLHYPDWYFDRTQTILIHPRPYKARVGTHTLSNSIEPILGGEFHRAGETIYRGPIVLNWRDIEAARIDSNDTNWI
jgi:MtfA peptidase